MFKINTIFALHLLISTALASPSFEEELCTESNPCYHVGGEWHFVDEDNGWNSYTITSFTVDTVKILLVASVVPVIHNSLNRFIDYLAYKFDCLSGLRDGGGEARNAELKKMANSLKKIEKSLKGKTDDKIGGVKKSDNSEQVEREDKDKDEGKKNIYAPDVSQFQDPDNPEGSGDVFKQSGQENV